MTKTLMTAASALVLMTTGPAMADNMNSTNSANQPVTQSDMERNWEQTKDAVSNAAVSAAETAEAAYQEASNWIDTQTDIDTYMDDPMRMSGVDMMGMPVYNQSDEQIGSVADVVLNQNGDVDQVVIEHGGVMGIGSEQTAVSYNALDMRTGNQSGLETEMTQDQMASVPAFRESQLTQGMYLASNLIDSNVVNEDLQAMASVENIIFEDGEASKLVVSFNDGSMAPAEWLVDFEDADITMNANNRATFQVSMRNN